MLPVGIGAGAITGSMIQPGAVTGQKITGIAGAGMTQDNAGLLDVNVDNVTLGITSIPNGNYLHILPFSIGSGLIIPGFDLECGSAKFHDRHYKQRIVERRRFSDFAWRKRKRYA